MRQEFEAWVNSPDELETQLDGSYVSYLIDVEWQAWQAATERSQARIAELEANLRVEESYSHDRDEIATQNAMLREALESAIKVHGYTSGVLVDALTASSSDWLGLSGLRRKETV